MLRARAACDVGWFVMMFGWENLRMFRAGFVVVCFTLLSGSVSLAQEAEDKPEVQVEASAAASVAEPEDGVTAESSELTPVEDMAQKLAENELAIRQAEALEREAKVKRALTIRTAVYNLELQGIEESMGRVVTDAILAEVRKLEGISAIGMEEITQMISLEAQKQMMGCESSESCLAQIAGALGVDELITGALTQLGENRVLTIRRIDQRRAKSAGTVQERLKAGSGEEFLLAVGPSVEKLYPSRVYRPGTTRGVPEQLVLRLNPPPVPKWVTESVGWSAAGAAVMGGVGYLLAWNEHRTYSEQIEGSRSSYLVGDYATRLSDNGQMLERASMTMVLTSAALGAVFGALYALTDWDGYGDGYAYED